MNIAVSPFNQIITALMARVSHNSTAKNKVHITLADNIISIVKPTRCTNVSNLFYFGMTFYMFRTVFPSIIGSSRLYIQQQTDTADCLLASSQQYLFASKQTAVSVWHMPVVVCTILNSWWWTEKPSETWRVSFQNKINLIHWCIWLVFNIEIIVWCTALWT